MKTCSEAERLRHLISGRAFSTSPLSRQDLDLTETALRDWGKRADVDSGNGPKDALTTPERDELTEMRRHVKRLEMEREL